MKLVRESLSFERGQSPKTSPREAKSFDCSNNLKKFTKIEVIFKKKIKI